MGRVESDRQQQRAYLALEIVMHPFALGRVAFAVRNDVDAMPGKRRHQFVVVQRVLTIDQRVGRRSQVFERFDRVIADTVFHTVCNEVRGCPDLEKFIQVGRNDAKVAQPLQQRHVVALCPVQYACVEGKNTVVAIEQREIERLGFC